VVEEGKKKRKNGAVNVKQACVWVGISRAITQIYNSNLVAFFMYYIYRTFS
jgi:hypothetical protein